jgi:hypothetical protein
MTRVAIYARVSTEEQAQNYGIGAHDTCPPGVESAEAALRGRGFGLTAPRRAVLEVVRGIKTHPTAEEVHRLVIRREPGVSLGTVYRNLRLLVDAGLLGELRGPQPASTPTSEPTITSPVSAAGALRT